MAEEEKPRQRENGLLNGRPSGGRIRSKYEILVALREAKGNRAIAAATLDMDVKALGHRVSDDPQLKQLFGGPRTPSGTGNLEPLEPPTVAEVVDRAPGDLPIANLPEGQKDSVAASLKLISLVSPQDTNRLINGLKAFDFSEASLEKIRALGSLAENTGRFIAVSLEKTHQNYVVQQFALMELASDVRRRLLIPAGTEGHVADEETRGFLHKNYVDMVRESGRGVERMLQVAEVITRMLEASSSHVKHAKTKRAWKKVTAAEAHDGQAQK